MSFMSDYQAALNKLKKENGEIAPYTVETTYAPSVGGSTTDSSSNSFMEAYRAERKRIQEDKKKKEDKKKDDKKKEDKKGKSDKEKKETENRDKKRQAMWQEQREQLLAEENEDIRDRLLYSASDISPTKAAFMMSGANPTQDERKWFEKGAFEDGYDFGDITKTILGSVGDLAKNIDTGIVGMGEKVVDAMAMLAPGAYQGAAVRHGVQQGFDFDEYNEQKKAVDEFVAKDLYDEAKVAKVLLDYVSPIGRLNRLTGINEEADSVFGAKSDSLAQSAGQLAATVGLSSVGVPWWVTTGATTFGAEAETALREGATHEEATVSAAITAAGEILSEKISGGIKFGGKTLDAGITKALSRGISNKFVRTALNLGVGGVGEGLEELVAADVSSFGKWLTYQDEEELKELLFSEEAMDEKIEAFIGGTLLGGTSQIGNAIKSNANGVDAVTGLTANEQKVVDELYKERIAEEQTKDKETRKKNSKIYDDILDEMDKGYISIDKIESILGGDTYKTYKDTIDSEDALRQEFNELNQMKQGEMTGEQIDRRNELKEQLKELESTSQRNQLRDQLGTEVFELVKGDRLAESYNERGRRSQAYEADLTKYDAKQQSVIQKAVDSGILNNTRRTHEFVDLVAKISADKGVLFDFTNNERLKTSGFAVDGKTVNGYWDAKNRTVGLNIESAKALQTTVGHEITHVLEGTEVYSELQNALFEYAKTKGELDTRRNVLSNMYKDIADADIDGELTADLVGEYLFSDPDFINRLSTEHRTVFQKIYDEVKYLFKVATAGSQQARDLARVKKVFDEAWRANVKATSETKHSLGYHAGDLGKSEHLGMISGDRDTGHFGFGTYFVGDQAKIDGYNKRNGNAAPIESVDFSKYNLYRPTDNSAGHDLHRFLRGVNTYYHRDANLVQNEAEYEQAKENIDNYRYEVEELGNTEYEISIMGEAGSVLGKEGVTSIIIDHLPVDAYLYEGDIIELADGTRIKSVNALDMIEDIAALNIDIYDEVASRWTERQVDRYEGWRYQVERDAEVLFGMTVEEVDGIIAEIRDEIVAGNYNYETAKGQDSASTRFMKRLGYEGIDVRHLSELDNTTYGSVIYDLKGEDLARKQEIGTAKYSVSDSDGKTLYTGSQNTDIQQFKVGGVEGSRQTGDRYGRGVYLTTNESTARGYAGENGRVYKINANGVKIFNLNDTITDGMKDSLVRELNSADKQFRNSVLRNFRTEKTFSDFDSAEHFYNQQRTEWKNQDGYYAANKPEIKSADNATGEAVIEYTDFANWENSIGTLTGEQLYDALKSISTDDFSSFITGNGYDGISFDEDANNQQYVIYKNEDKLRVEDPTTANPTTDPDVRYSVSEIDSGQNLAYNGIRGEDYARTDEFRNLQAESQRMSDAEWNFYLRGGKNEDVRRRVSAVLRGQVDAWRSSGGSHNGVLRLSSKENQFNIYENVSPSLFHDIFEVTRKYLKNGELVDLHGVETTEEHGIGYVECDNYLSEDGLSGFSITPDGDLISVFNAGKKGGFLRAISEVVKSRAKTLDCYASPNQNLMEMYEKVFGFKAAAVMDYNMEYDHDNIAENHNMPQVAFMVNTEADVETRSFTEDQYNEAVNYRNGFVPQASSTDGAFFDAPIQPSLSEMDEQPSKGRGTYGEDIALETTQEVAPETEELLPDDLAPSAEETDESFDALIAEADRYAPPVEEDYAPVTETVQPVQEVAQPVETPVAPTPQTQTNPAAQPRKNDIAPNLLKDGKVIENKQTSLKNMLTSALVDKGAVFERLSIEEENPELQAKYKAIGRAESAAQYFLQNGADGVTSLKSVMRDIEKSGLGEEFDMFLKHMLNTDRMSLRARFGIPNRTVFGDGTTARQSQAKADKMLREYPQFKEWADSIYAITKHNLQMQVDNRFITQETADKWMAMYPHYVPISRDVTDNGQQTDNKNKVSVKNLNKRAKGGTQAIMPLMETLAERTIQTYKAVAKNRFGAELMNMLGSVVSVEDATTKASGNIIESGTRVRASDRSNIGTVVGYYPDSNSYSVRFENTQSGKTATVTLGADVLSPIGTSEDLVDRAEWHEEMIQHGNPGRNPTYTIYEDGKKVTFEITDEMYRAMQPAQGILGKEIKPLMAANNIRRGLLTEYNLGFLATNAIKDAQDVLINSQHPIRTYAAMPEAWYEILSNGKWYQERMAHGGAQDTYFDKKTNTFTKEKSVLRKIVGAPLDAISAANNFIEQVPRMAEYIASRKMGHSIDVSMMHAARVTTDFSAGGDVTKFFNKHGVTFLNASVQGAAQHVRNIREAKANGLKGMLALGAKITAAGLPFILLNNLLWDDDEDYEELSDYVKQNYYIVGKFGDGQFVRIPKGRALAVVQNAFEQMEKLMKGEEVTADDVKTFGDLLITNLAPNNPLDNNLLAPIGQALRNETWYGEDLVPSRLQEVPAAEQYDESTDSISKWLGEKTNISPMKINYVLDQYSGVVGDTVLPMLTLEAEGGSDSVLGDLVAPIKDKFTADSTMDNQNVTDFYDLQDELTVNANSMYATDDDKLKSLYMNAVSSDLADLYAEKREIQNSYRLDSVKYERIREIQDEIVELMKDGMDNYEGISYDDAYRGGGRYAAIGDKVFSQNEETGEWYKLSEEQQTKYEVTSAAGDANYATDGYNHYNWYVNEDGEAYWRKIYDDQYEKQQEVTSALGITPDEYWGAKSEYDYAYKYPENYAVSQAVGGYDTYRHHTGNLYDIKADKDENGDSIPYSRKDKVIDYINRLDLDYGMRLILFKNEYNGDDTYNNEIIDYINGRDDLSYDEKVTILRRIGFDVDDEGNISWD